MDSAERDPAQGGWRLSLHERISRLLGRWSFDSFRRAPARSPARMNRDARVAYVLLRYPGLTDTFVRREIEGLRRAGVSLDVYSRDRGVDPATVDAAAPAGPVTYFGTTNQSAGRAALLDFARRNPVRVFRLCLFVIRHRDGFAKTWRRDRGLLYDAVLLARLLEQRPVSRLHAPWADRSALLVFIASRLLDVPFTVQARASEIHRSESQPALADRLRFAELVITNSRYNERFLRSVLANGSAPPIHVVYNGLDLRQFALPDARAERAGPVRILSVGRLVEPKGFAHLLRACALLRDAGHEFTCEIIGGPRDPDDTVTWLELRKLHRRLALEPIVCFRGAQSLSVTLAAYRRSDLFVLPCVRARSGSHDITPNALIEAMASGLPVISTTSGAIPEIVEQGVSGVLVPPGDASALADAMACLLADAARRETLGRAARRKVQEQFDLHRNVLKRVALLGL